MPHIVTSHNPGCVHTATIPADQSLSNVIAIPPTHTLIGLVMPDAWDTANLTFRGSWDNVSWGNLYDWGGDLVQVATGPGRIIYLTDADLRAYPFLVLRSGTVQTPVNQTAARTLTLITAP